MQESEITQEENEWQKCEIGSENVKLARGIENWMQGFEEFLEECKGEGSSFGAFWLRLSDQVEKWGEIAFHPVFIFQFRALVA